MKTTDKEIKKHLNAVLLKRPQATNVHLISLYNVSAIH